MEAASALGISFSLRPRHVNTMDVLRIESELSVLLPRVVVLLFRLVAS